MVSIVSEGSEQTAWKSRIAAFATAAWPALLTFVVVVAAWEWAIAAWQVPSYLMPAPSGIWQAIWFNHGSIFSQAAITGGEAIVGFVIGSVLGALLGIAFAYSTIMSRALLPYVIAANTIPVVGIAPIIILWLGNGVSSKIAVTALLSFFPLALNMMKGLQSYDRTIMDVFHVAAASSWQRFLKMRLPSALPYVFVGLKLNVTFSVIGAIVAEFVQADRGLGFVIMSSYKNLNMPRLWAAMAVSAVMGVILFAVVARLERIAIPWHSSMRDPSL
ncbi:ABC transporter permease [Labrys monachus]|uniref:NitT/TauT family transport system permease protein n=1 Tax=Labrys monachus TaxID=217067 RepID=A0ABU0FIC5_9HYPH|nr:ABC transporter permease [Labrys monachus]MDQ0394362.1 NitT/TauT family transport system permease protein [Labrys monachus]